MSKKIPDSDNLDYLYNQVNYKDNSNLDLATKILLSNMGELELSKEEREKLITDWQDRTTKKSELISINKVNLIPRDFPTDLKFFPLPDGPNDYIWNYNKTLSLGRIEKDKLFNNKVGLSIVIPTFNRSRILDITLACLVNQITQYPFEIIVADDGSQEDLSSIIRKYEKQLDIKYVRQRDNGYQLCAIRNLGLRCSKYLYVAILDCDMAPNPYWIDAYMKDLILDDNIALIGPRKYIDTQWINAEDCLNDASLITSLPEVITNNIEGSVSIDWRLDHFKKTEGLRLCDSPFRFFSGGNVAFAKKWLEIAGEFDEEFTHWGGEDNEFGYRLYRAGCFFKVVAQAMAYHQEPPGKENETDRSEGKKITLNIVKEKVPYIYRKLSSITESKIYTVPLVSIYMPVYNCEKFIQRSVDSALNQTITDLEVCIVDDGSTDNTLSILKAIYGNNPRVRIFSKENGGIASASNMAVKNCRGFYIGQLDGDDYLEPDAVEVCLKEFFKDRTLACVYTANRNVNPDGSLIANGYNWPEFSREKFTTAMIVHHFRMFTIRAWNLTEGFNENISNAVDFDMYLKLSEVGKFKHINKICYNRVLHGNNTSIDNIEEQKKNHFIVVNEFLERQKIRNYEYISIDNDKNSRRYAFLSKNK
nr:glycosyltransferase [Mergibacter septicus]